MIQFLEYGGKDFDLNLCVRGGVSVCYGTCICVLGVVYLCVRGRVFVCKGSWICVLGVVYLCVRGRVFVC